MVWEEFNLHIMALKVCLRVSIRRAEFVGFIGVQVCMLQDLDNRNLLLWWWNLLEYIFVEIMSSYHIYQLLFLVFYLHFFRYIDEKPHLFLFLRTDPYWNSSICWFKVLHVWEIEDTASWRTSKLHYDASFLWSSSWIVWADFNIPFRCCQETDAGIWSMTFCLAQFVESFPLFLVMVRWVSSQLALQSFCCV